MHGRLAPIDRLPTGLAPDQGLSAEQASLALRTHGPNDIVVVPASGWLSVARDTVRDPMLWFLLITASLFALLRQWRESVTLVLALLPLVAMDGWLHRRTLVSAAGLASRLASTAKVMREGVWVEIPAREVVPGDLAEVRPGVYFPADGVLISGTGLQADESTLTGESLPVAKSVLAGAWSPSQPLPAQYWGTAGTRLLTGTAQLRVLFTGPETRYGDIALGAAAGQHAQTPLQHSIARLVTTFLAASVLLCLVLAAARLHQGHGWIDAVLSAVTLAVAALPEEFPVVYTFFLGLGVFRLARRKALVRRGVAVENIGRITCIVSDKTGTMTAGTLALSGCRPSAQESDASVIRTAQRASRRDSGDPLDEALHLVATDDPGWTPLADFPFTEARRRETRLWRTTDGELVACTKGAPETVLAVCRLGEAERQTWRAEVATLADSGHKVIACALSRPVGANAAAEPGDGFRLIGLLAFADPAREGVAQAVAECRDAGIRVVMITGDHPSTAAAIGREVGLGDGVATVVVLEEDSSPALIQAAARDADIVARATPQQKLALVKALQSAGERVAVTGDGVNDVPALRQADVGIAMGERGTRSAREVAPIVLLDDNFGTIVAAISEGRQLFLNLRLAFAYLVLIHLPLIFGAAVIPLLGLPLLYLPIHIVWLELVIHPTAMLAFQDLPAQGPLGPVQRHHDVRFFSRAEWAWLWGVGAGSSALVVGCYLFAFGAERDADHARALAFSALLLCSAAFAAGLTHLRSAASRWVLAGTLVPMVLLVQWPALSAWASLRPLHAPDWALVLVGAAAVYGGTSALARSMVRTSGAPGPAVRAEQ